MAQIIDFATHKKRIESRNSSADKKNERPTATFSSISERNKKNNEKVCKERKQANEKVMKSYRIK